MYEINFSPKLTNLCKKCSEAISEDAKTDSLTVFLKFTETVYFECRESIVGRFSAKFPSLLLRRCNAKEFEDLRRLYNVEGTRTTAFYVPALGVIAVNIESIFKNNVPTFVLNLVLGYSEELLHAAYPRLKEPEIKRMTHDVVEEYLDTQIPEEYKNMSVEESGKANYGRD